MNTGEQREEKKMTSQDLAKRFLELAEPASRMKQWAVPPELHPIFLGREGYYPFFTVVQKILEEAGT